MPENNADNQLFFHSTAVADGDLLLRSVVGRDEISRLFEFELILQSPEYPLERNVIDQLLIDPVHLGFGMGDEHPIHGVLRSIEMLSASEPRTISYRAVMVPALWSTTQTFRSRIFQEMTVPGIVKSVLEATGLQEGRDFDLFLDRKHPRREYVVQYQETDFQFLSRLLEYEGIFYFFEHGLDRAKIVIADANEPFARLANHETITYDARQGVVDQGECIKTLTQQIARIPRELQVRDYNYRTPSTALIADTQIDEAGHGLQVFYGEHFNDVEDGRRIARIRAEEIRVQRETYTGTSVVRELRSGTRFTLEQHFFSTLDQEYIVTAVSHSASYAGMRDGAPDDELGGYLNTFTAIPAGIAYRPKRSTPKPKILGLMHAKVDGEKDDIAAPIDEHGRYRVLLPFDTVAKPGGRATRWIRMAQPHAGPGYGMHFPQHIGAEVIVAHIDGDPDRPIIVASVPNHEMSTPAQRDNATQAVIRTRTGITMRFENATGRHKPAKRK